jgi:hypothetical protein
MAKQQKFSNTSNQENATFNKGMVKDVSDVYMSEGMWTNAINAINNSHNGESGNIGNEMSNEFCATAPYTIIGMAHISEKKWVLFSTDNTDSEIGIFDEADCSYQTTVNDACLNFAKSNLITAVVKSNYDCTKSVYWQDNRNPDRVLNLDNVPYQCQPVTIEVETKFYDYTLARADEPTTDCGRPIGAGGNDAIQTFTLDVGSDWGEVLLTFNAQSVPDRYVVEWDGDVVIDTGYVGSEAYSGFLQIANNAGTLPGPSGSGPGFDSVLQLNGAVHPNYNNGPQAAAGNADTAAGAGTASFVKDRDAGIVTVTVYPWKTVTGTNGTVWTIQLDCPTPLPGLVRPTPPGEYISYTDIDNNPRNLLLGVGESVTICAKEDSIINKLDDVTITKGALCDTKTEVVPDPEACGAEECTEDLDCNALRLHPLVTQPCVEIKKAQGSGQIQNGSYIAVVAYSENGIKLTDYCTPSYPASIWDHSGIGGGLEINVSNLDEDYDEYELVIIGVVNQNTVAKRVGFYSTDQTKVTIDMLPESLITIPINNIPLRTTIYEKSEKMSEVNDYLIRSAVTTQPFVNYQPQANQIVSKWVVTSYPQEYYRDGGINVGYMRDEVYSFFIRWVYETGNYTNSYHIPGREATTSDLNEVAQGVANPNVIDGKTATWECFDTSSTTESYSDPYIIVDSEFRGLLRAKGRMGYWESTEQYPNEQPEVWGELCGKPIRHHKMPSSTTVHIHENEGEYINVLGVEFENIEHPVDENGVPIPEIVGYEILRGSREGNRSIIAKGMFNNMREFPYDDDGDPNTPVKYGLYQNYPYNDLRPDPFLTLLPSNVLDGEAEITNNPSHPRSVESRDANAITVYRTDVFSFHSPETTFIRPYLGSGTQIRLYAEEIGISEGRFKYPYKHPEHVLITDAAFISSIGLGFAIALVDALGESTSSFSSGIGFILKFDGGASRKQGSTAPGVIADTIVNSALNLPGIAGTIAGVIGFIIQFGYFMGKAIDQVLRIIRALSRDQQYALQFDSKCYYNQSKKLFDPISRASKSNGAKYVGRGIQRFTNDRIINNLNRNKYVAIFVDGAVPEVTTQDTTRQRLFDIAKSGKYNKDRLYENPTRFGINQPSSAYYGALKVPFDNQYGQIRSIQQIPISKCITQSVQVNEGVYQVSKTDILHGGDVYINRFTEKNPFYFFNTWLFDVPNGTEIDMRDYINGPLPRYWVNFYKFTAEDFQVGLRDLFDRPDDNGAVPLNEATNAVEKSDVDKIKDNDAKDEWSDKGNFIKNLRTKLKDRTLLDSIFTTPSDFHRLDRPDRVSGWFRVKDSYFYLFYNGLRDFFCESELNMAFRDWGESLDDRFYDVYNNSFNDIDYLFRTDKITNPTLNKYDLSMSASKLWNQFFSWSKILPRDYDPEVYSTCFQYFPKRSVYSLQHQEGLKRDNWRNYLPLNYKDLSGRVSTIKSLNSQGAVILFEDAEPVLFTGVDSIQTQSGTKFSIGDGGLFASNNMQAMVNADDTLGYGTCISSRSAVNTPHGLFFISQDSGKIFQFAGQMMEISKNGMKHWFSENLPSWYRENDPEYTLYDNPIVGSGCMSIYDPTYELVYFMKKAFEPVRDDLLYDEEGPYYINPDYVPSENNTENCNLPLDVAFVLDITGSMSSSISSIKDSLPAIVSAIADKSNDNYRLALITANERSNNVGNDLNTLRVVFTQNNEADFATALEPVFASGGGGYPEPTDTAILDFLNNTAPTFSTVAGGVSKPGEWRDEADKIMFIITDATPSNSQDNYNPVTDLPRIQTLAQDCADKGIKLYAINTGIGIGQPNTVEVMQVYADISGGTYYESPTGEIQTSVLSAIADIPCPEPPISKIRCPYTDNRCFEDKSWTVSYDPKNKMWVSFHDWSPTLVMPSTKHFNTILDDSIWRHNDRYDSYGNYYGTQHPWEVEYPIVNPPSINTLRNIEYTLEVYEYSSDGKDRLHLLDENFDRAVLYNSEQISGLLKLNIKGKNTPAANLRSSGITDGDIIGTQALNIPFSKEENKYRFNKFYDITNNRGEFVPNSEFMFTTRGNGFRKDINENYVNYNKPTLQRKKFRHYGNRLILRRMDSGNKKMILKLVTTKQLLSRM